MSGRKSRLYFEAHVTCDPVFETRRDLMEGVVQRHGFRLAKLLMRKREGGPDIPHVDDAFCTARSKDLDDITARVESVVRDLRLHGFGVRRYKIEDTLLDSKMEGDRLEVLA